MMDHEEMRLECLKMARAEGLTGDAMTERADYLYKVARYGKAEADRIARDEAFEKAESDRRRRAHELLEQLEQLDPNVVAETDKATIYKQPPFKDYTPE